MNSQARLDEVGCNYDHWTWLVGGATAPANDDKKDKVHWGLELQKDWLLDNILFFETLYIVSKPPTIIESLLPG
jgi:hypothetical protein